MAMAQSLFLPVKVALWANSVTNKDWMSVIRALWAWSVIKKAWHKALRVSQASMV